MLLLLLSAVAMLFGCHYFIILRYIKVSIRLHKFLHTLSINR